MTKHLQQRVNSYVNLLANDIGRIQELLAQVNELASADNPKKVHLLAQQLTTSSLDTEWVVVPRQYSQADWYLLAFDRFLQFAKVTTYDILTPAEREELTLVFPGLDEPATFEFEVNHDDNGGAYFTELGTQKRLFYWSLTRRQIYFNADAITDLLVENFRKKTTAARIRPIANLLTTFGRYMEQEFDYQVDYNILETQDDFLYPMKQKELPAGMLDRLFVLSADSNYFLQAIPNGAGLVLDRGVEVRLFYVNDATASNAQRWHFQVMDGQDAISWLDVLLDYDFIGAWYLVERRYLAIESEPLVFEKTAVNDPETNDANEPVIKPEVLIPKSVEELA
ncbi:hypothetical protein ACFQGR_06375 [Weissella sagaensis]|jgi:hypothetical protein|uniref:WYL domain-containing protein n=1 Tax=Weissella sagaensis TaxID=2559928 RepID=A0ABW1RU77_9LACO|nr:hypothetical protein [Weissella sagaensis]UEG67404.1 hypothetical protein GZH44_02550 [Weissella hellenica]